jgi:uncharacterized membrane protein YphA (DoxX/SURF4 family)
MFHHLAAETLSPLLLRLALAAVFLFHGLDMVQPEKDYGTNWNEDMPKPLQAAVAWGEVLGGAAMALGFLTRLAALGLAGIMVGAIVTVHAANGFSIIKGGYEYNAVLITMCVVLMLTGGGKVAVDRFFRVKTKT